MGGRVILSAYLPPKIEKRAVSVPKNASQKRKHYSSVLLDSIRRFPSKTLRLLQMKMHVSRKQCVFLQKQLLIFENRDCSSEFVEFCGLQGMMHFLNLDERFHSTLEDVDFFCKFN